MKPTSEQADILDAFTGGADLRVIACAGSGKTTTLRMLAETTTGRGLYLAYNKTVQLEAASKFGPHVDCRTGHSLAYRAVGHAYRHRLNGPRLPAAQVADILGITGRLDLAAGIAPLSRQQIARLALTTIERFTKTADASLAARHVPREMRIPDADDKKQRAIGDHLAAHVLPYAQTAWADITDADGRLRFAPDSYLKIWQLSGPRLDADFILYDEAQDADPAISDVVGAQEGVQKIVVGDPHQAIYGWRGAADSLSRFGGTKLHLSQSFRFGDAVAAQANKWLALLGADKFITGWDQIASTIGAAPRPDAILCRSNAGAIDEALDALADGLRPTVVGGGAGVKAMARAALQLKAGTGTDHPELCLFASWDQVQEYADGDDGRDLRTFVTLIDRYGPDEIITVIDRLSGTKNADVTISTAYKAKGLEWASVRIAEDYPEPRPTVYDATTDRYVPCIERACTHCPGDDCERLIRAEEARLAYVAVTRARLLLDPAGLAFVDTLHGIRP